MMSTVQVLAHPPAMFAQIIVMVLPVKTCRVARCV